MSAATFAERFTARYHDAKDVTSGVAVLRKEAAKILLGVPWQFIPIVACERRPVIELRTLLMLCCCLDDEEVGATPGNVTAAQLHLAWMAAGHENWLKKRTLRALLDQAHIRVLASNPDLLVGAIMSRMVAL
jgi:hypothetical protein